jgi:hypothetical protein
MMDAVHNPTDHRRVLFEDVDVDAVDATRVEHLELPSKIPPKMKVAAGVLKESLWTLAVGAKCKR